MSETLREEGLREKKQARAENRRIGRVNRIGETMKSTQKMELLGPSPTGKK